MRVAALILAAGAATRFGSAKPMARLGARTFIAHVTDAARAASLDPIIVVQPSHAEAPADTIVVHNDRPEAGLSESLRLAIRAVPDYAGAAIVLLADQPTVTAAHLVALVGAARAASSATDAVATRAEGRIGPPVLVLRRGFALVDDAEGDEGLGPLLSRRASGVAYLDVAAHAPDVDTPDDLARLEGGWGA